MPVEATPLSAAVFHVLLALSDGPLHGYGIMRRVEEASGRASGPGTIYGSIQRLCDADWIAEGPPDDGDARRGRTFALTHQGREALALEARRITRLARLADVKRLAADANA
jgi:DNA-binding PadR family transcriptional regulator